MLVEDAVLKFLTVIERLVASFDCRASLADATFLENADVLRVDVKCPIFGIIF